MRGWRSASTATTITLTVVVAMALAFGLQEVVAPGLHYLGLARHQAGKQRDAWVLQQLPGSIAGLLNFSTRHQMPRGRPSSRRHNVLKSTFGFLMPPSRI